MRNIIFEIELYKIEYRKKTITLFGKLKETDLTMNILGSDI